MLEYLDLSQLNCLNEAEEHTFKSIVSSKARNTAGSYLLSDADEQLLLNIPVSQFWFSIGGEVDFIYQFNQAVRVRSIVLQSKSAEQAPKTIKLLINRPSLGFEDVEDATEPEVAQIIELPSEVIQEGKSIPLRFVRFQSVNSLHVRRTIKCSARAFLIT